jgi:hypothetical protein
MYLPLIVSVIGMIALVTYLMYGEYESNPRALESTGFVATLLGTIAVSFAVLGILVYTTIRDT